MRYTMLLAAVFLLGCEDKEAITFNEKPISWDMSQEDDILAYAKIQLKTYQSEGFTEVTPGKINSLVSQDKIRVWADNASAYRYKNLQPGDSFPTGSTIIRVLYDDNNNPKKITATIKAAEGMNPDSSDWVFAVANEQGTLNKISETEWEVGAIASCNACHVTRLDTDGLFGLAENL